MGQQDVRGGASLGEDPEGSEPWAVIESARDPEGCGRKAMCGKPRQGAHRLLGQERRRQRGKPIGLHCPGRTQQGLPPV